MLYIHFHSVKVTQLLLVVSDVDVYTKKAEHIGDIKSQLQISVNIANSWLYLRQNQRFFFTKDVVFCANSEISPTNIQTTGF